MRRTIIIGDIHGCFDELIELLEKVGLQPDDLLVSVGDLVDRGPSPGEVVRLFRERPNSVAVMGNHERKHVRGIFSYAQEITRLQLGDDYAETVDWMRTLPYSFETDDIRVVHAAMLSGVPLADQKAEILCGSTSGERELAALFPHGHWHDHYTDAKPVVFGHHVTGPEPLTRDGRIFGLDTGACHGWNLTALCVPGFTVHSVAARADHWSIVKREWQLPVLKTQAVARLHVAGVGRGGHTVLVAVRRRHARLARDGRDLGGRAALIASGAGDGGSPRGRRAQHGGHAAASRGTVPVPGSRGPPRRGRPGQAVLDASQDDRLGRCARPGRPRVPWLTWSGLEDVGIRGPFAGRGAEVREELQGRRRR
ncbi:metallophosphoesterase family protein [Actinomadura harenae]|uniref:metallophosphoesterase family protein n=1 Tax=Actinomadura harenae TaxID=2483351 RepID=UPI0018F7089B|nr:metallophosphoesterase family protein [Actinomadura harenae]